MVQHKEHAHACESLTVHLQKKLDEQHQQNQQQQRRQQHEAAAAAASAAAKIQELTELLANCQVMPCVAYKDTP